MSKLEALKEQVEGGVAGGWMVFSDAFGPLSYNRHVLAQEAYNGSVDAAIALMEAVLPGWGWEINKKSARLAGPEGEVFYGQRFSEAPARLFLYAIIDALISQEDKQ